MEAYWVLAEPTPLLGMKQPRPDFPWPQLQSAGVGEVVALEPGTYDPAPLRMRFETKLQDLVSGGAPADEAEERRKVEEAVMATVAAWRSGQGVVVHCQGGRGRSGTVLGCVLRELGFPSTDVVDYLNRLHQARDRPGWPESPWQRAVVEGWGQRDSHEVST